MCKLIQSRRNFLFRRNIKPLNIYKQVDHNIFLHDTIQNKQQNLKLNMRLFHTIKDILFRCEQDINTTFKHIIFDMKTTIIHIIDFETTKPIRQVLHSIEFE